MITGQVAPLAGAWIETQNYLLGSTLDRVAPLAGAWIETSIAAITIAGASRRAPRGRVD